VTFLLAVIGYAGLTITAILTARGRIPTRLWRITAAVIVTHVALVWAVRYRWDPAVATRNGYAGFVLFHGALGLIVASVFLSARAKPLILLAFAVVTVGALGAVFRYVEVSGYRPVVIGLATAGAIGLPYGWHSGRSRR
jgi:hypothetical protein